MTHIVPQTFVKPEEDARLGPLEARIEREWRQFRPKYFREIKASGRLQSEIRHTAIWCIETLNQFEAKGLNPDQGREAIRELILPPDAM